jgi:hypothetical protein
LGRRSGQQFSGSTTRAKEGFLSLAFDLLDDFNFINYSHKKEDFTDYTIDK